MAQLFKSHTLKEHTQSLADFMPNGISHASKNQEGTVHRKLLRGLAAELKRVEDTLREWMSQMDPFTTTDFIRNFEREVGIPDKCFTGLEDIETRRKHVVVKVLALGTSTEQDFIDLAHFLGVDITISHIPEVQSFLPVDIPYNFVLGTPQSRYILIIRGALIQGKFPPFKVPFTPGSGVNSKIPCLFDTLKPANTVFIYENESPPAIRVTSDGDVRITEDGSTRMTTGR